MHRASTTGAALPPRPDEPAAACPGRHAGRGQALVELALILPVMLVLFAAALDLGRLYYAQVTINNAAKEGALEASRNPTSFDSSRGCDADTNRVICLVVNEAKGSLITIAPSDVAEICTPSLCPSSPVIGNTVAIKVTARFGLISPLLTVFFGGQTFPISATSIAQLGVEPRPGVWATPTPTPVATASPTPTPTPTPVASPSPTPVASPTPSPTPVCVAPTVKGNVGINPGSGQSASPGPATLFTMSAPTVDPQIGCSFVYTWTFGDGLGGSGSSVTHQYANAGTLSQPGKKYFAVTLVISIPGVTSSWTDTREVVVNS